jgi:hypothetical protein
MAEGNPYYSKPIAFSLFLPSSFSLQPSAFSLYLSWQLSGKN